MRSRALLAVMVTLAWTGMAQAFINPNFTPVDLVKQSETILLLEFAKADAEGFSVATVVKALKGKFDAKTIKLDFMAGAYEDQGKAMIDIVGAGGKQGMLFVGAFGGGEGSRGFLDLGGKWVTTSSEDGKTWEMEKIDWQLLGTWAGSTDMLVRVVSYVQANPDAVIRVTEGTSWSDGIKVASLPGKISAAMPVDLAGDGKLVLYLADDQGDRLFAWDGKAFQDATAAHKLSSASLAATWADFNADRKLDLASWNGKELQLFLQQPDGTFSSETIDPGDALKSGCTGLTTVDCGRSGRPAIVASTPGIPTVILPEEKGWKRYGFAIDALPADLGASGACLTADFDGDALPDILQIFEKGSLLYKGTRLGEFTGARLVGVRLGAGRGSASLGDFDGDGLLDVVTTSESANCIWQNLGGGKFQENIGFSGEIAYIAKAGAFASMVGDFNNDGLQDVTILYTNRSPHPFFNRGFRCFGHARMMDPEATKALPEAAEGQQAGCLGDFNGDGALDMALVLTNGDVWVFPRRIEGGKALAVTATLSLESPYAGPLTVTAWRFDRLLGSCAVRAGGAGAFFGAEEPGPIVLKWQMPGGKPVEKEVILEGGPVRAVLDK